MTFPVSIGIKKSNGRALVTMTGMITLLPWTL